MQLIICFGLDPYHYHYCQSDTHTSETKQNKTTCTHTHTHYPAVCMYTGIICTHTFLTCCSDNKISCTNCCNYVPMNHLIHYYTPLTGQHSKHTHSHMYTYVNGTNCKLLTLKSGGNPGEGNSEQTDLARSHMANRSLDLALSLITPVILLTSQTAQISCPGPEDVLEQGCRHDIINFFKDNCILSRKNIAIYVQLHQLL